MTFVTRTCTRCQAVHREHRLTCRRCDAYLSFAENVDAPAKGIGPGTLFAVIATLAVAAGVVFINYHPKPAGQAKAISAQQATAQTATKTTQTTTKSKTGSGKKRKRRSK